MPELAEDLLVAPNWEAPDGTLFGCKEWRCKGVPKAVVVAMHGLSCRVQDFEPLGGFLSQHGYAVAAWNLRGQGLDPKTSRRGSFLKIGTMLEDLAAFSSFIAARYPDSPLILCGESMGALLSIRAAATPAIARLFSGLILLVPVVDLAQKNPYWLKRFLHLVGSVFPWLRLPPSLFVHGSTAFPILTRDPVRQRAVETAPHRLGPLTLPFLLSMEELMETSFASAAKIAIPVLIAYGGHDVYIRPEQVERFFQRLTASSKERRFYPKGYHQLLFDLDKDAVLADVLAWLDERFPL